MVYTIIVIGCILLGGAHAEDFKFPDDIQRCDFGDSKCIIEQANNVLEKFSKDGHSGIDLAPIDPMFVPVLILNEGDERSPVRISLRYENTTFAGLKDARFYQVSGFQESPIGKYEMRYKAPTFTLTGTYVIDGQLFIIPIAGDGTFIIEVFDLDYKIKWDGKSVMKNGAEYLQPENFKFSLEFKRAKLKYNNLFNGNKLLGDTVNLFINENIREVFDEIKEAAFVVIADLYSKVLFPVFEKVPYKQLFKEKS